MQAFAVCLCADEDGLSAEFSGTKGLVLYLKSFSMSTEGF